MKNRTPKFAVGDLVQISRENNICKKGYESGCTLEIFKINCISETRTPVVYFLKDLSGDIEGLFYEQELSRVRKDLENETYEIETILKEAGKGSSMRYFVKWKGYPAKFNLWIEASELKKNLTMKDQLYIVLSSNSNMQLFSENETTHFVIKSPGEIHT